MVALDICAHLSAQRHLSGGFFASAQVVDDDFAESIRLVVSSNVPSTLQIKQRSFLSNEWFCTTIAQVQAKQHQELLVPKLQGLVSLELVALTDIVLEAAHLVKAALNVQQTYFSDFFSADCLRFATHLQFQPFTARNVSLVAKSQIASNESFLSKLTSLYKKVSFDTGTVRADFIGKLMLLQHTGQYALALDLPTSQVDIAVYKLSADVAPSRIFNSEQIIHVKL